MALNDFHTGYREKSVEHKTQQINSISQDTQLSKKNAIQ